MGFNARVAGGGSDAGAGIYTEDAAASNLDKGVMIFTKRTDTAAASAGTDGDYQTLNTDALGLLWTHEYYAPSAEDNTVGVIKVEQRYSTSGALTTDTQVKASAGFVHTITVAPSDILPTAGTLDVYDNTAASGTKIFSMYIQAAVFYPFTIHLDVSCANGIYVDFTTTADVNVFVSYR